jgi:hypothetical protein
MYKAFDHFLGIETWYTRHTNDEERFLKALSNVVKNANFNPDEMGAYMRAKIGINRDDVENAFNKAIDHYTAAAWAVRGYLNHQ